MLTLGRKTLSVPILQGGMGVGVSLGGLAGAVAACGGMGVHFPGQPVMPGVLILEALAQTGAVAALSLPENKGKLALFGGIKNARFRKQVTLGNVLTLHCELVEQHGPVGVGKASAWVDGKCAATAELTFVLTEAADNR